jgi:hypothetical protein
MAGEQQVIFTPPTFAVAHIAVVASSFISPGCLILHLPFCEVDMVLFHSAM